MEYHVIVNKRIYSQFKNDIIRLNIRLFCDDNFSSINTYQDGIDLLGTKNYLPFCEKIIIDATTTFIDYVNILLTLRFLNESNYEGAVIINYINLFAKDYESSKFSQIIMFAKDYKNVESMINSFKSYTRCDNLLPVIPGSINFINFYNNLVNKDLFLSLLEDEIEEFEGDKDQIAEYLANKYSQFALDKEFYLNYLTKE